MGVTIIVITHEMKVIDSICDRVAVIDKSRIAEVGRVSDVFTNPQSDIAKELILPGERSAENITDGTKLRIVFDGKESTEPIIANLILESGVPINILFADTKDVGGTAVGQMLIQVRVGVRALERVCACLDLKQVKYTKEV